MLTHRNRGLEKIAEYLIEDFSLGSGCLVQ